MVATCRADRLGSATYRSNLPGNAGGGCRRDIYLVNLDVKAHGMILRKVFSL